MKTDCYICDECFETFEQQASMSKTDKYAKGHRVRCPSCASEAARQAMLRSNRPGTPADYGVCTPWNQQESGQTPRAQKDALDHEQVHHDRDFRPADALCQRDVRPDHGRRASAVQRNAGPA